MHLLYIQYCTLYLPTVRIKIDINMHMNVEKRPARISRKSEQHGRDSIKPSLYNSL